MMNLENKTILITGANCGIGRALVQEALKRGNEEVLPGSVDADMVKDPE